MQDVRHGDQPVPIVPAAALGAGSTREDGEVSDARPERFLQRRVRVTGWSGRTCTDGALEEWGGPSTQTQLTGSIFYGEPVLLQ